MNLSDALALTLAHRWRHCTDQERLYARGLRVVQELGDPALPLSALHARETILRGRGAATGNRYLAALKAMLRTAEEAGGPPAPPIRSLREPDSPRRPPTVSPVGPVETFLAETGLRASEVGTAEVSEGGLRVPGKGGKVRWVPLTARARELAPQVLGMSASRVRASCTGGTPHQWRHAFVTRMFEGGAHPEAVRKIAGHSDLKTTLRYAHVSDGFLQTQLDKALGQGTL